MARQSGIKRRLANGWTLENSGLLVRGTGRTKVAMRPTELMPSKSGERDFNPNADAFALRLGAEFVGPNRYRLGRMLIDANGAFRDETECPICGSTHGEYRFRVRVEVQGHNPKPWESAYTYCPRCCTDEECDAFERKVNGPPAAPATRRGRQRDGAH